MKTRSSGTTIKAFNLVSTKAPKQPTKEGMVQLLERTPAYSSVVQKVSALAGVEGKTSPT